LALPPYSVSTTNPLPAGVSAKQVVRDVVIDNLIENAALMRGDAALLNYSDAGNRLASEQDELSANVSSGTKVLGIHDDITSIQLGAKQDPNDASVQTATIVEGSETERQSIGSSAPRQTTRSFQVILWVVWSASHSRYLLCDTANA
jgi:hypothetical protein